MLSPMLLMKLPPELHLIVSRETTDTELDMDSLLKVFKQELEARERASGLKPTKPHSQSSRSQDRGRGQDRGRHQSSALVARTQDAGTGPSCCYCQQRHFPINCTAFKDVGSRKQILKNNGHCYNCLRKGHVGCHCRSASRCRVCSGHHHTSNCEDSTNQSEKPPAQAELTTPPTELNPEAPSYQPVPTSTALCSDKGEIVLLQTAYTTMHNLLTHNGWLKFESSLTVAAKNYTSLSEPRVYWHWNLLKSSYFRLLHLDQARYERRYVPLWMLGCVWGAIHPCRCFCMLSQLFAIH